MSFVKISKNAQIGKNVQIGDFTVIHDNVIIGDNTVIESHCLIGKPSPLADKSPLIIGQNSLIRSHCVFYESSSFGDELKTGHHATIREHTHAGKDLQIGTHSDLQGRLKIGDHVRIHSNVFVSQGATIGHFVWLFPHVVLTDDPHPPSAIHLPVTIEDYAAIGAKSVILPGVRIGTQALVAAGSVVSKIVAPHKLVAGNPARELGETSMVKYRDGSNRPAYPWMAHFRRGYPKEIQLLWDETYLMTPSPK